MMLYALNLTFKRDVALAPLVRWRIGGPADYLIEPDSAAALSRALIAAREAGLPVFVLGDGSNMLMDTRGFRGLIIKLGRAMAQVRLEGDRLICGAGVWAPHLALVMSRAGLSGIEHTAGIPGTLGGLVLMNGGSQRKGVGSHVAALTIVDRTGAIKRLERGDLSFDYRQSSLQGTGAIITEVELQLEPGDPAAIRRVMIDILASRRAKFPKKLPNCGSTFLSNPKMYETVGPPGRAIEEAGLKGATIGGAQVSHLHANFIVNRGGATSDEVLGLIAHIRQTVFERTGYKMDCEARFLTAEGEERPAHEFTDAGRFDTGVLDRLRYEHA